MRHIIAAITMCALFCGCSQRVFDGTLMSTKAIGNREISVGANLSKRGAQGEHIIPCFLFIPFGIPNMKEAVDNMLRNGGGDYATNVVVYQEVSGLIPIFWTQGFRVTGDVHRADPSAPMPQTPHAGTGK
jgi:hypothetical protein